MPPLVQEPPDHVALVIAASRGDAGAFEELYRRFGRLVHGVLLAKLPPEDAEDVAQEVFTQAWRQLANLRKPAAFGAWIASIARSRAADLLRARQPHDPLDESVAASDTATTSLEVSEVLAAVRALPEAYRETLLLRLVEGHSGPEIAALTGLTPDSVRVNLHRGFKLLRDRLGENR
jgi:RNA polymerase sigma-70 factor (ECF subfamily)